MDGKLIIPGILGLLGLVLAGPFLAGPAKFVLRLALCVLVGAVLLLAANFVLAHFGLHIAINPFTLLAAGVLQVPGVFLLAVLNYFFS
ncbi:pro-sigmaK processing inhibitor BofA family protein [Desulfotomaculum copahuensis]|uniref:SigmaK-factor processing regulatory BofA n=1 Tax=Desulfotomaculum copahuensis TaxID=1838280 RepID=A0A1B7LIA7_9FIRM|nr:pro-sigmaK processing inhibitor BofA family protein [Desulfotomaculum copahuensis]OAT86150.1 SigmaK-factor processing regulatory BofA [Desulfotomaculum copahuensis]